MKSKRKLIAYLLNLAFFTASSSVSAGILLELDNQTYQGDITDQTADTGIMEAYLDNQSVLEGNLNLQGNNTNYYIGLYNGSSINGNISLTGMASSSPGYTDYIDLSNSNLNGNIFVHRTGNKITNIDFLNDSRWDGKLEASSNFSLTVYDSVKIGGVFYNRAAQAENTDISINVGGGGNDMIGRLEGPIRILGDTNAALQMTRPVSIFLGENGVIDTGPEGMLVDNNGQGLEISSETEGGIPARWIGNVVVKENHDPNGVTQASRISFSGGSFTGSVTVPMLSRLDLSEMKWIGDITILPQLDNRSSEKDTDFSLYHVDFQGNVDYTGRSFDVNLYDSQWNGQINAKSIDDSAYFSFTLRSESSFTGDVALTNMESGYMQIGDGSTLNGDITLNSGQQIDDRFELAMSDGSSWTGNLDLTNAAISEDASRAIGIQNSNWTGHIIGGAGQDLNVFINADNQGESVWNMTGSSDVRSLDTDPNVEINFVNQDTSSTTPQFHTLTTDRLYGGAQISMRVGATGNEHDQIVINEDVQDDYLIKVQDNPAAKVIGEQTYKMVDYSNIEEPLEASFTFTNIDYKIELGGYVYDMVLGEDGTFSIEGKATPDENGNSGSDNGENGNGSGSNGDKPSLSNTASAAANSLITSYMFNEVQMHNLQQRMGDLRNTEHLNNVWIRSYNGQFDSKANGMLQGFDMDYNGVHIGADTSINLTDHQRVYLGVMAGTTKADVDYNKGSTGKVKDHQLGVYSTYVTDNQFYVDAIGKYSRVKQEIDARMQSGGRQRASASKDVYSFSVEAGKRFNITDSSGGFYIEPQAQLLVTNNESTQFRTDKGLTVDIDGYTSVQARGGVQVGYQFNETKVPVNIYARSQLIHEFKDRVAYYVNDSKEEHSFKGSRWQNSLGTSININKQHSIHADIDYENSNKYKHTQWNIGYRYSF
ncbi:autotransporter outer membrane beta-barrel domain-containing protein [Neisseria sp. Ec49-e6-T10]|uniref:autotransporter outer membrane beta-barrel domain-containing protein n=1 Tax=Neisseria sp. Ec49-e6-T10 TaxID=3140744 RepID=UPI003EBA7613